MGKHNWVEGRDKNRLLSELGRTAQPGSTVHEQQKAAIIVRCVEDIEKSIDNLKDQLKENATFEDKLSNKLFWLNVVLTLATIVGAAATLITAIK